MTRLAQSVAGGILITFAIFVAVFLTDSGDSMLPVVERHPFAWVLFWPDLFWDRALYSNNVLTATILTNVALYTFLTYAALSRRNTLKDLE
jgi:hypothetical protein